ncbi:hypothetical protein [Celeribacter arenosi]|uniref:Cellulose biosynthesis protein BcsS n=1 Tax=Celeribacter arenosi TaxID=792649 RepID=A0ABP7JUL8_9RHOB
MADWNVHRMLRGVAIFAMTAAVTLTARPVEALEFSGASLQIGTADYVLDTSSRPKPQVVLSVEAVIAPRWRAQFDLAYARFPGTSVQNVTTAMMHAGYHHDPFAIGLFFGVEEDAGGNGGTVFGAEAGFQHGRLSVQGHVAQADFDATRRDFYGGSARLALNDWLSFGIGVDRSTFGANSFRTWRAQARYAVTERVEMRVEAGKMRTYLGASSPDEAFAGVHFRVSFGREAPRFALRSFYAAAPVGLFP